MKFHVVLERQKEGGFVAYIQELSGCHTQGETKAEALENIKEALDLYREDTPPVITSALLGSAFVIDRWHRGLATLC